MKSKAWLLLVVIPIVLAAYMLRRPPVPAPANEEPAKPVVDEDAKARELVSRLMAEPAPSGASAAPAAPKAPKPVAGAEPNEQEKLRAIESYATAERQKIETWYADQITDLKTRLQQRIQHVGEADRPSWEQFYQRANEVWSAPGSRSPGATRATPAGEYLAIMTQIADSKQATQADFVEAQKGLAWMWQDKLAAVQAEVDKRMAEIATARPRTPSTQTKAPPKQATVKVEAVIAVGDNRFSALIGDALVSEGSMVQGYRVKKIGPDSVQLEKDGTTWTQKVK